MGTYRTRLEKLPGSNFKEVYKKARSIYKKIEKSTKRRPYLRSAYFSKQKVFFSYFWIHLRQKREPERARRLKFFECAIELIKNNRNHPDSMQNPSKRSEMLHRFSGVTKQGELFYVQIKENKKSNHKDFMSVFPAK